jgi:CRISPR/Cas system-associated exonuclease Cas4 (RecB family)
MDLQEKFISAIQARAEDIIGSDRVDFSVDGMSPWSVSKYKTLNSCPLAFYLKYIIKVQDMEELVEAVMQEDSIRTDVGKLAHEVLDHVITKEVGFHEAMDLAGYNKEQFKDHTHLIDPLEVSIREFSSRIASFKRKHDVEGILAEDEVAVDKDWNPVDFSSRNAMFRSKIDLQILLTNKDRILMDHKLGGNPDWGIRNHEFQLESYGTLVVAKYPEVKSLTTGIHFIEAMEVKMGSVYGNEELRTRIRNNLLGRLFNAVDKVYRDGMFKAEKNFLCTSYCDYRDVCSKHRKPRDKNSIAGLLQPVMKQSAELLRKCGNPHSPK